MTTALKLRRGTTAQHASFTGADGEVTVDTTKKTVVVHDGSTAGGTPLLKEANPSYTGTLTGGTGVVNLGSGQFVKDASGLISIGPNTASFGTLNIQRYSPAPYATVTIQDNATPANTVGLYLRQNGTSPAGISTAGSPLAFYNGGAGANEVMRMTETSRVGINYSTPSGRLDVAGDGLDSFFRHSSGTYLRIVTQTANGRVQLWADATNGAYPEFDFATGGSTRFVIRTNGQQASTIVGFSGFYDEYKCRAWVNFNGSGTLSVRASGNVSSVTDNGTGNYTVNFTTAMPDSSYAVTASGQRLNSGDPEASRIFGSQNITTSSFRATCVASSGVLADAEVCLYSVFR